MTGCRADILLLKEGQWLDGYTDMGFFRMEWV